MVVFTCGAGKSTSTIIANSVWFDKSGFRSWRATANGLEGTAEIHNDSLLALDEIGEVSSREVGKVSYMLANGQGKARATQSGDIRKPKTWRLLFISTGEVSLAQHIREGGGHVRAGQEVRILDIAADTGKYGIFEDLHGFSCGAVFSNHLANNAKAYYGTPARKFLYKLVKSKDDVIGKFYAFKDDFFNHLEIDQADGQVKRAANRFCVVAFAGELATEWGITGWPEGMATQGAFTCFQSWLEERGGEQSQESIQSLKEIKSFIEQHGESRFTRWRDDGSKTIDRVGYSRQEDGESIYYFFPETFRRIVCKRFDYKIALNTLKQHGALDHDYGRLTKKVRIPRKNPCYFYVIKYGALNTV